MTVLEETNPEKAEQNQFSEVSFDAFVEALESGEPVFLVLVDVNTPEEFAAFLKLHNAKNAMAVVSHPGADLEILQEQLLAALGSEAAAEYAFGHPEALPFLVARTSDKQTAQQLRSLGGVDAVIDDENSLEQALITARAAAEARAMGMSKLNADTIAAALPRIARYINLRDLETVSSDTAATLVHLNAAFEAHYAQTGMQINRVLEAGVGEGRIAVLMYLTGREVVGVDVTPERLASSQLRLLDEVENFVQGDAPKEGSLARLAWDTMSQDDRESRKRELSERLDKVNAQYPGFSRQERAALFGEEAFYMMESSIQRLSAVELGVLQQGVEAAIFAWNTFNFMGGPDQMVRVLNRMHNTLPENGMIFIEVPDRATGPYPQMLADYMRNNPMALPGMVESRPSSHSVLYEDDEKQPGSVRYFPSQEELEGYLKLCGFELRAVLRHTVVPEDAAMKDHSFDELTFIAVRK